MTSAKPHHGSESPPRVPDSKRRPGPGLLPEPWLRRRPRPHAALLRPPGPLAVAVLLSCAPASHSSTRLVDPTSTACRIHQHLRGCLGPAQVPLVRRLQGPIPGPHREPERPEVQMGSCQPCPCFQPPQHSTRPLNSSKEGGPALPVYPTLATAFFSSLAC